MLYPPFLSKDVLRRANMVDILRQFWVSAFLGLLGVPHQSFLRVLVYEYITVFKGSLIKD